MEERLYRLTYSQMRPSVIAPQVAIGETRTQTIRASSDTDAKAQAAAFLKREGSVKIGEVFYSPTQIGDLVSIAGSNRHILMPPINQDHPNYGMGN